jgi:nucleoside-diphosphate-sugar epimerase
MSRLLVLGPGYTASRLIAAAEASGWQTRALRRDATADPARVADAIAWSTHILSSVPPGADADPILAAHGSALASSGRVIAYLSSTGVYGDSGGAWVDESAATAPGRVPAREAADRGWQALPGSLVFRLPGIYGPGRSPIDRVADGTAYRVDLPGQMFSRIHVDDIVSALLLALDGGPPGVYNIADDHPAPQSDVVAFAARLIGRDPPPIVALESLSATARGFYAANRRIANGRAKRLLDWQPRYPDYRAGLRALSAITSPASASAPPAAASIDQR